MSTETATSQRQLEEHPSFVPHVIDGAETSSADGDRGELIDPWARQPFAEVAIGHQADVDAAVASSRRAFDEGPWPRLGFQRRSALMNALADAIVEHGDELAMADVRAMGMPVASARGTMVLRATAMMRVFADHPRLSTADVFPTDTGHHIYTRFDPAGVVAAIVPWNAPLLTTVWKVAPALAWGNTVVCKPSTISPTSATLLARLALAVGFPPGVFNVVHGSGSDAGSSLVADPRINRITFTGATSTGRSISRAAAENLVPLSLELGGKSAHLVFADADLDRSLPVALNGVYMNAGQVCFSGSRIYVQRPIYERFLERFVAGAQALVVGDPSDAGTEIGPLASEAQFARVCRYLETVPEDGGEILTGGPEAGWVVRPTVVVGVRQDARVCREEIFGPVAIVAPFDTEEEAIELANDSPYGLAALVSTESLRRAHRLAGLLRGGITWVNCFPLRDFRGPYGGVGDSGFGREGGHYSRDFFTEPRQVVMEI